MKKQGHTRRKATPEEEERVRKAAEEEDRPERIAANRTYARKLLAERRALQQQSLATETLQLLLQERHRQELTLSQLEARSGITSGNLSKLWNLDEPNVTLATVERIANAMNVKVRISLEQNVPSRPGGL